MSKIKFRLEAKLKLAEYVLENLQVELASELYKLEELKHILVNQQDILLKAISGQREAGIKHPKDLALWHVYVAKQNDTLLNYQEEFYMQELRVDEIRTKVLESYKEVKKLQKLKQKQIELFEHKEKHKEQLNLDELGQVLFSRKQKI